MSAPKHTRPEHYAVVRWTANDVQFLRPEMSDDEAAEWLANNEETIKDLMVQRGRDAMEDLLPPKPTMQQAFLVKVQILIVADDVKTPVDAAKWVSGLLSTNPQVKDWSYMPNMQSMEEVLNDAAESYILPKEIEIPVNYHEGDFL